MSLKLKAITDDNPYAQDIKLDQALRRSDLMTDPAEMMERLLTVLYEKNVLDVRDIDRIVMADGITLVPEDYTPGGSYNPFG